MSGIKSQDIVVLLKLVTLQESDDANRAQGFGSPPQGEDPYSVRSLEAMLGISKTEVNASIKRIVSTGMAIEDRATGRPRPHRRNLYDFIVHGLKFVFPAKPGALTRGIPTAFAAPMLKSSLFSGNEHIHVWPSAAGREIGQSVTPLFKSVPDAASKDIRLYAYLALVDAVRLGNQRENGLAREKLSQMLELQ
jgi:hypothetical protein